MRRFDQRFQFVFGEGGDGFAARPHAIIGIDLDPVRAVTRLMAHRAHDLVDAACFLGALRHAAIGAEFGARRTIAAGRHDRARGDHETRSRHDPFIDRALHGDVGIARAFRAQIAQQREAGIERRFRVANGQDGAIGLRLLQHLIVPQRLVVGMQEQMRMQIHQTRQQRQAGKIDGLGVARRVDRAYGRDAIAFDEDVACRDVPVRPDPVGLKKQRARHRQRQYRQSDAAQASATISGLF